MLEDFAGKVAALEIDDSAKAALEASANAAWNESARPGYQRLLAEMKRQQTIAPTDDGVWRLPDGAGYYRELLKNFTTTDLSPDEVHNIGLREVERIHGEMRAIMQQVGFEGSLKDFFEHTRMATSSSTNRVRNISPMPRRNWPRWRPSCPTISARFQPTHW